MSYEKIKVLISLLVIVLLFLKLSFVNDIASAEQADLFKSIIKDLGIPKAINFNVNTLRFELRDSTM